MEERFLYEIRPIRPFTSPDGKEIKKACSAQLTKDEVKEYIKKAMIYRKFSGSNIHMVRVTLSNLDEVHVRGIGECPTVIHDEERAESPLDQFQGETEHPVDEIAQEDNIIVDEAPNTIEENPEDQEVVTADVNVATEIQEETPVVEESSVEEETVVAEEEATEEETVSEEAQTEESVDDILKEGTVQSSNNNNYHGKNKKKHH